MRSPAREWQERAACRDLGSSHFYSPDAERGARRRTREQQAKLVCAGCPVLALCREQALRTREPYGVWGGLSERERSELTAGRTESVAG